MYCKYCGNKLDDQATFCSKCGKRVVEEVSLFEEEKVENPQVEQHKSQLGGSILGFAITGMVFAFISLMAFLIALEVFALTLGDDEFAALYFVFCAFPILGWIFSGLARAKVRQYKAVFGETEGKATVGKNIALPAFIINIVTVCISILLIVMSFGL